MKHLWLSIIWPKYAISKVVWRFYLQWDSVNICCGIFTRKILIHFCLSGWILHWAFFYCQTIKTTLLIFLSTFGIKTMFIKMYTITPGIYNNNLKSKNIIILFTGIYRFTVAVYLMVDNDCLEQCFSTFFTLRIHFLNKKWCRKIFELLFFRRNFPKVKR